MNKKLPIVAIIGQTNAGKSSLFNRLIGRQDAIVAREAGTTRDSVVRVVDDHFVLVDTAGLKDPTDDFEATIQTQVDDAIESADSILLVQDITTYPNQTDRDISKKVLKSKKPVILVLNKADLKEKIDSSEYLRLGIKDILVVSAEHNQGIATLKQEIYARITSGSSGEPSQTSSSRSRLLLASPRRRPSGDLAPAQDLEEEFGRVDLPFKSQATQEQEGDGVEERESNESIKIALIGRPNVGKSHLFNTLSKKQQAIVAPVAGTTRDVNRVSVKYHGQTIELLDTAGVRRPGKIEQGVEKFSVLRTVAAIEESDICLLLMDVNELNTSLDQKLAGMIADAGRGLIIVVTKWDSLGPAGQASLASTGHPSQTSSSRSRLLLASPRRQPSGDLAPAQDLEEEFGRDDSEALAQSSDQTLHQIAATFDFVPWPPVIFTSSVTGKNVTKIFDLATEIAAERNKQIPTSQLNKVLQTATLRHPPAGLKNTHPKLRYVVQTDVRPPWFVIYGSHLQHLHWSYKRYLERQFRDEFGFNGTPIKFSFRDEKQIKANRQSA